MGRRRSGKGRRRRANWLVAMVGRMQRRLRSYWHWEVLRTIRERFPALSGDHSYSAGELRRFPQRSWR